MKYYNFLVKRGNITYNLARGVFLEEDSSLAVVREAPDKPLEFTGEWLIIDVASGLYVLRNKSKKKLLEEWNHKKENNDFMNAISNARKTMTYIKYMAETSGEKAFWRESGYEIK